MPPKRQQTLPSRTVSQRTRSVVAAVAGPSTGDVTPDDLATRMTQRLTITKSKGKEKANVAEVVAPCQPRPVARTRSRKVVSVDTSAEALADTLQQKLVITNQRVAENKTQDELCAETMRSVNIASRALSGVAESGWKYEPNSSLKKPLARSATADTISLVDGHAKTIREGLVVLRELRAGDLDVERAASSAAGKLISLEAHQLAIPILTDMHPQLRDICRSACSASDISAKQEPKAPVRLELLSLPLPDLSTTSKIDSVTLTLLSTYLLHAIITFTWSQFSVDPASDASQDDDRASKPLQEFADTLHDTPTLLHWIPYIRELPAKYLDSTLTRAYTILARASLSSSIPSSHVASYSEDIYRIRQYGLLLLLGTSPSAIKPDMFWDQTVKFTVAFVKSAANAGSKQRFSAEQKKNITSTILVAYDRILNFVGKRRDQSSWTVGSAFIGLCEYWLDFAKRAEDVETVKRITTFIRHATDGTEGPPSGLSVVAPPAVNGGSIQYGDRSASPTKSQLNAAQIANICALFTQAVAVLDQPLDGSGISTVHEATDALNHAKQLLLVSQNASGDDQSIRKAADRVWRAMERLRRSAGKVLDTHSSSPLSSEWADTLRSLVDGIVEVLTSMLTAAESGYSDLLTPALDSLFTLGKVAIVVTKATIPTLALSYLTRAHSLAISIPEGGSTPLDLANYLRCISGAFHNLGATLYQASRHAEAIQFFEKSCTIGEDGLRVYRARNAGATREDDEEEAETRAQWTTLEDQLYRRWEILGVCHSKIGDRKTAYAAFRNCIKSFPFFAQGFAEQAASSSVVTLFDSSQALRHIAGIIDRMTYCGLCDLFLPVHEVSVSPLLEAFAKNEHYHEVLGTLLERQAEGLASSKWKASVQHAITRMLQETISLYDPKYMPIRRARAIIKYLELVGLAETDNVDFEELADQAERLLEAKNHGLDVKLSRLRFQYLATLKLRMAHIVHQRAQTSQFSQVVRHAQEACTILKSILAPVSRSSGGRPSSPVAGRVMRKPSSKRPTPAARTAPGRTRARVAKTASALPVTPKSRKSISVAHMLPIPKLSLGGPPMFEEVGVLLDLLHSTAHLLGLLGQIITKVQVLLVGRRVSDQHIESRADDHVKFSIELAHEYVNLGKTAKASNVYSHTWTRMTNMRIAEESRVLFLLRYSESLIAVNNVGQSSASYCDAYAIAQAIEPDTKGVTTAHRVLSRASLLERAAIAAKAFSLIQYTRDDPVTSINGMLQALRLWNRAFDTLERLVPPATSKREERDSNNPFLADTPTEKPIGSTAGADTQSSQHSFPKVPALSGIGWRIAEGLLGTLFSLTQAYVARGSPREAEFFAQQAKDLSTALNMPAMTGRALARLGEIYLHLGQYDDCHACLTQATALISNTAGPDAAEIHRLYAEYKSLHAHDEDAQQLNDEAMTMLEELDNQLVSVDSLSVGPRKSNTISPKSSQASAQETLAPSLVLAILRQNIWLLHAEGGEYQELLERIQSLPPTNEIKAEESALMAKLTLGDVYGKLQADMFLSSLAESAITLPMGMRREKSSISPSTQEILGILNNAERLFWSDLKLVAKRGNVFHVRDAAVSLALIRAFQDTLGSISAEGPVLAASLIDKSTAITLRREVLEVVQYKFNDNDDHDDLQWPSITSNGSPLPAPKQRRRVLFSPSETDDIHLSENESLVAFWKSMADKYKDQVYDADHLSAPQAGSLPPNWTVLNISVTEDRNTMFVARQRPGKDPLIFYIPLKDRRESDEEEYLTFDRAITELQAIIEQSDEGTKQAASVKNDRDARAAWWANRSALDKRLKELLENIEFCWLGAFKTILSEPRHIPAAALTELRERLDSLFNRNIILREKKQSVTVQLNDALLECFACLSPKSRDEELEDLVYFILDLYQFHGIPVATAEVDIDQVVVDFRTILEEFAAKYGSRMTLQRDSHTFLVLDKNVQGIPWESIPALRGRSVSRIPNIDFLLDRLQYAQSVEAENDEAVDRLTLDPRKTYFVLNPSGDLKNTEGRFADWLKEMKKVGWSGIVGQVPSELQLVDALTHKDLVIYFGHGGAEQYIRSRKVRHLPRCAATMLWGCSSGALKEMGAFDRTGTPYNYMLAGCPTLVANLWDVTDRDIDKFSQSVFDKMHLTAKDVAAWQHREANGKTSIVTAVAQSREVCKLKYLTGAAPVVYGIPFYL